MAGCGKKKDNTENIDAALQGHWVMQNGMRDYAFKDSTFTCHYAGWGVNIPEGDYIGTYSINTVDNTILLHEKDPSDPNGKIDDYTFEFKYNTDSGELTLYGFGDYLIKK